MQREFLAEDTVRTHYWHKLNGGKIQCDLCPRKCQLKEGQRGMCFVRACKEGEIVLTTYGRSSGFCIDPIEKKPLNHFLPGTAVLSFGTAGCNLGCLFCQNWDISKSREIDKLADRAEPEIVAKAAKQLGCKSVAFTYNDPVIFMEYAIDIAKECRKMGIKTVAVTAGYISEEPRKEFYKYIDAANIDLKSFSNDFYRKICKAELQPVLDTLKYVYHQTATWLEITTLLIPGHNDSDREVSALSEWIVSELGSDVPLHFSAFHPDYRMMDVAPTPAATLRRARKIAMNSGLNFVYVGNVHDEEASSTYCKKCKKLLIGRDWYEITAYNLDSAGRCNHCGAECPGIFLDTCGNWGQRRQPVRLENFR
ncbi:MAG: AmmeMemoRadiSam system radical SAM enzyme [Candidatus Dadabacteria bacterium]|nr:MAG: AmmeMemoRadiSam system radical SAM enzyme [Candidatus Dadabacteria bacterium]